MSSYDLLLSRIRLVRRRWRAQMLAKGLSLFLACAIALLILGVWGAGYFGFKAAAIWFMRIVAAGGIVYAATHFLLQPMRRRVTEVQIAQYVEEQYPELQDRLVTAVELGRGSPESTGMLDLLIHDALDKTNRMDFSVFKKSRRIAAYGSFGAAACFFLLLLLVWGPDVFHFGFNRLYMPWTEAAADARLTIAVTPGNLDLAKGSDQLIKARLIGFDAHDVKLFTMNHPGGTWSPVSMEPEARGSGFVYLVIEIQSTMRYYVEAQGTRSETYTLTVSDLARVERIGLRYTFPAYTGMPQQTLDNQGDISALKGTRVDLNVRLNHAAKGVRLLFDDKSTLGLSPTDNINFAGNFTLTRSGSYVVQVESEGKNFAGSPEYEIEALEDAPPRISIEKPQHDLRATSVEEVFTQLKADDDIGLSKVELHYSVNGDKEKTLKLYGGQNRQPSVTAAHTFFLEEFGLQPGDIISYYGKAFDNNDVSGPGTSASDIYFVQVRPFEQKYTQSQQGGPPGANGEGQDELSRREKEIISATFKLLRDQGKMEPKDYTEGLKALSLVQRRLQLQAQGLTDRLKRRGVVGVNEDFAKLAEYIEAATKDMEGAAIKLGAQKPSDALPDEQKALQQLMRAESLFREIQIAFSAQMGGGGGSDSQAKAEDLADLFKLEMDKLKNQYETVQRDEQKARDEKIDEAMRRLKELAQRQEQLNERNRSMAMRGGSPASGSADASQSQQELLQEAEQLRRQLERLSRERSSPELNRVGQRLQESIQEMKRALEQSQHRNPQDADARGSRALQQLEDARKSLERGQQAGLSQGMDQAVEESRQALEEQTRIRDGIAKLAQDKMQTSPQARQQRQSDLIERKGLLADKVRNLGKKIDDLSRAARNGQREAGSKLNDASSIIRDRSLPERILSGNQMIQGGYFDFLKGREEYIRSGLEEVQKQLESARGSLGQTREGKLEDAVNRTRQLAQGLDSLQRRMQSQQAAQGQSSAKNSEGRQGDQAGQAQGRGQGKSGSNQGQNAANQAQNGSNQSQTGSNQSQNGASQAGNPTPYGQEQSLGSYGPPVGAGNDERRQFRREAQERLAEAQELRRMMERGSAQIPNMDKLVESLRNVEGSAERMADISARLKAAIDLLNVIDRDLSRELAQTNQKDKYLTSEDSEAPSAYKKLVEEYYRSLAKGKP